MADQINDSLRPLGRVRSRFFIPFLEAPAASFRTEPQLAKSSFALQYKLHTTQDPPSTTSTRSHFRVLFFFFPPGSTEEPTQRKAFRERELYDSVAPIFCPFVSLGLTTTLNECTINKRQRARTLTSVFSSFFFCCCWGCCFYRKFPPRHSPEALHSVMVGFTPSAVKGGTFSQNTIFSFLKGGFYGDVSESKATTRTKSERKASEAFLVRILA